MKNKKNLKILILLALVLSILNLSLFITNLYDNSISYEKFPFSDNAIKISANHAPIHIDGNWSAAKGAGICTGSGTYDYPYVIKDFEIDGGGSGSCILIENSDVYFIIKNCTVYNLGSNGDAGIYLNNVDNGQLINNNCSNNIAYGIYLKYSNNNTISGNTANNNDYGGIYLYYSNNITALGNAVNNNRGGIDLMGSNNSFVSENTVNNNNAGISLFGINNTIFGNTVNNNSMFGIASASINNTILGNTVNNTLYGITLGPPCNKNTLSGNLMNESGIIIWGSLEETSSHNIDISNLVNGKPVYYYVNKIGLKPKSFSNAGQVILVNCNDSSISNLNISHSSIGISLYYCKNNTISKNNISQNIGMGICLWNSNNSFVLGNTANNNTMHGLYLYGSNNNNISGNTANNNSIYGIYLYDSNNNFISENNCSYNTDSGIYLRSTANNMILRNNYTGNEYGVYLYYSNNNTLYFNNFINNVYDAYSLNSISIWNSPEKITYTYNGKTYTNYFGNYWSNYTGNDANGDGIGDTPYDIDEDEKDNFPLMESFENYLFPVEIVLDDTTPPIVDSPPNITYEEGTTGHIISWNATDDNPDTYIIYKDGVEVNSGAWTSGTPIKINVDGLAVGTYNYTIVVSDAFNKTTSDTVFVNVTSSEVIPPVIAGYPWIILIFSFITAVIIVILVLKRKITAKF